MEKYLNKVTAIIILVVVAFFVFVIGDDDENDEMIKNDQQSLVIGESVPADNTVEIIIVDVAGAVNAPKVVELPAESRVADAIAAAGGLSENADTSQINQAAFLNYSSVAEDASKIDINTATSEELQTLTGVGPATAEKIISYRSDVGYFSEIEELKNVDGIGEKTFNKLKDHIMV